MSAIATVPLLIAIPGLTFTDAFFEAMSGLSTTGATVLVGVEHLPASINLWRHALNSYGGMGIIVLVVAILPRLGVGGMQVYKAETPGPMQDEKLTPRITQTARALLLIVGVSTLGLAMIIWSEGVYPSLLTSLRHVAFNLVSIATDCGLVSQDYAAWPMFAPMWILMLSSYCANTGSTGGGIKMFRTLVLFRQAGREIQLLVHPAGRGSGACRRPGRAEPGRVRGAGLRGALLRDRRRAHVRAAAQWPGLPDIVLRDHGCINNAGPGLGLVGPSGNYQGLTDFQTWTCALAMLLGRLEIFSVLVLFTPVLWRK